MAMIFDSFPSVREAEAFARSVAPNGDAELFATQAESDAVDPFPYQLQPPIVHVPRQDSSMVERFIEARVTDFGGQYAGT